MVLEWYNNLVLVIGVQICLSILCKCGTILQTGKFIISSSFCHVPNVIFHVMHLATFFSNIQLQIRGGLYLIFFIFPQHLFSWRNTKNVG